MSETSDQFVAALVKNAVNFNLDLDEEIISGLRTYFETLQSWNPRLHLVAPCPPEEFAVRHVLESLLAIKYIHANAHVVDIGSGGGLPIIPCLMARGDIRASLIESSPKKGVFLREALRSTNSVARASVLTSRFEDTQLPDADVITCRALERFTTQLSRIVEWAPVKSTIILFGGPTLQPELEKIGVAFLTRQIPMSNQRFVFVIERK